MLGWIVVADYSQSGSQSSKWGLLLLWRAGLYLPFWSGETRKTLLIILQRMQTVARESTMSVDSRDRLSNACGTLSWNLQRMQIPATAFPTLADSLTLFLSL